MQYRVVMLKDIIVLKKQASKKEKGPLEVLALRDGGTESGH